MKAILLFTLLLLFGCEDEKSKAEKAHQQAVEREVEARVSARTSTRAAEDSISLVRVIVYGVTAAGGVLLLHFLGAPRVNAGDRQPSHPEDRPPRSGGRVLDVPPD